MNFDCPPHDAVPAEGIVYRGVKHSPPKSLDMQTHHETGRKKDADPCLRKALSVFLRLDAAAHQVRLFPGWRKRYIARANLTGADGKLKQSGRPMHISWWPAAHLDASGRAALFRIECEVT